MSAIVRALLVALLLVARGGNGHGVVDDTKLQPAWRIGPTTLVAPGPAYPAGPCDTSVDGAEPLAGPAPSRLEQIGTSVQGRPIWAEYWGPVVADRVMVVVSQIHGNECAPQRMVRAVRSTELRRVGIWLIPTLDPDGAAAGTRLNYNGIDLNADGGTRSQPETQALMAFTTRIRPALTVHVHSPNGTVGWFGSPQVTALARTIVVETSARCGAALYFDVAGTRADPAKWFLWQGAADIGDGGGALLVELHAIVDSEVPDAFPRPPTQTLTRVDCEARQILRILDR